MRQADQLRVRALGSKTPAGERAVGTGARQTSRQTTLRRAVHLDGIGVHSGARVSVTLHPAEAGSGVTFLRTDQDFPELQATAFNVTSAELSTIVGDPARGGVATVEHLLAALAGLGVDNCAVEVDGPEMPILDGSAAPFVHAIDQVGIVQQRAARRVIKILKPVIIESENSVVELHPAERGFRAEVAIDFANPLIGRQTAGVDLDPVAFRRDVARARTFGFMEDVARLWAANKALGASLDNTVVVSDERVLNPEGLRFDDEFVRHKLLDAVGDLALAGAPLVGRFRSYRGGHRMNVAIIKALLSDPTAYALVEPVVRRDRGHADIVAAAPAYGPDAN